MGEDWITCSWSMNVKTSQKSFNASHHHVYVHQTTGASREVYGHGPQAFSGESKNVNVMSEYCPLLHDTTLIRAP